MSAKAVVKIGSSHCELIGGFSCHGNGDGWDPSRTVPGGFTLWEMGPKSEVDTVRATLDGAFPDRARKHRRRKSKDRTRVKDPCSSQGENFAGLLMLSLL